MDSEQLRHELAQLRAAQQEGERKQGLREAEAESACGGGGGARPPGGVPRRARGSRPPLSPAEKASATEARYTKLKEQHSRLVATHAELLRKVGPAPGGSAGGRGAPNPVPDCALIRLCRTQTRPSS